MMKLADGALGPSGAFRSSRHWYASTVGLCYVLGQIDTDSHHAAVVSRLHFQLKA